MWPRDPWRRPLISSSLLLCGCPRLAEASTETPSAAAETYLSEDFFPGLALLEPLPSADQATWSIRIYPGGQRPPPPGASPSDLAETHIYGPPFDLQASDWSAVDAAEAIGMRMGLAPLEPLQTPWGIFDAQGHRLAGTTDLRDAPVAFFQEGGVWTWPAVRESFEQRIEGVGGTSALLRTLSLRPRVFEVREFLSKNETEEVMALGQKQELEASVGVLNSRQRVSGIKHKEYRTSTQAWLPNQMSPLIAKLDQRVSELTRIPASHNSKAQLLRYGEGNYYHAHMDWTELELYNGQQNYWVDQHFGFQGRLATVFWYLNDVEEGGETIFPKHGQKNMRAAESGRTRHIAL